MSIKHQHFSINVSEKYYWIPVNPENIDDYKMILTGSFLIEFPEKRNKITSIENVEIYITQIKKRTVLKCTFYFNE